MDSITSYYEKERRKSVKVILNNGKTERFLNLKGKERQEIIGKNLKNMEEIVDKNILGSEKNINSKDQREDVTDEAMTKLKSLYSGVTNVMDKHWQDQRSALNKGSVQVSGVNANVQESTSWKQRNHESAMLAALQEHNQKADKITVRELEKLSKYGECLKKYSPKAAEADESYNRLITGAVIRHLPEDYGAQWRIDYEKDLRTRMYYEAVPFLRHYEKGWFFRQYSLDGERIDDKLIWTPDGYKTPDGYNKFILESMMLETRKSKRKSKEKSKEKAEEKAEEKEVFRDLTDAEIDSNRDRKKKVIDMLTKELLEYPFDASMLQEDYLVAHIVEIRQYADKLLAYNLILNDNPWFLFGEEADKPDFDEQKTPKPSYWSMIDEMIIKRGYYLASFLDAHDRSHAIRRNYYDPKCLREDKDGKLLVASLSAGPGTVHDRAGFVKENIKKEYIKKDKFLKKEYEQKGNNYPDDIKCGGEYDVAFLFGKKDIRMGLGYGFDLFNANTLSEDDRRVYEKNVDDEQNDTGKLSRMKERLDESDKRMYSNVRLHMMKKISKNDAASVKTNEQLQKMQSELKAVKAKIDSKPEIYACYGTEIDTVYARYFATRKLLAELLAQEETLKEIKERKIQLNRDNEQDDGIYTSLFFDKYVSHALVDIGERRAYLDYYTQICKNTITYIINEGVMDKESFSDTAKFEVKKFIESEGMDAVLDFTVYKKSNQLMNDLLSETNKSVCYGKEETIDFTQERKEALIMNTREAKHKREKMLSYMRNALEYEPQKDEEVISWFLTCEPQAIVELDFKGNINVDSREDTKNTVDKYNKLMKLYELIIDKKRGRYGKFMVDADYLGMRGPSERLWEQLKKDNVIKADKYEDVDDFIADMKARIEMLKSLYYRNGVAGLTYLKDYNDEKKKNDVLQLDMERLKSLTKVQLKDFIEIAKNKLKNNNLDKDDKRLLECYLFMAKELDKIPEGTYELTVDMHRILKSDFLMDQRLNSIQKEKYFGATKATFTLLKFFKDENKRLNKYEVRQSLREREDKNGKARNADSDKEKNALDVLKIYKVHLEDIKLENVKKWLDELVIIDNRVDLEKETIGNDSLNALFNLMNCANLVNSLSFLTLSDVSLLPDELQRVWNVMNMEGNKDLKKRILSKVTLLYPVINLVSTYLRGHGLEMDGSFVEGKSHDKIIEKCSSKEQKRVAEANAWKEVEIIMQDAKKMVAGLKKQIKAFAPPKEYMGQDILMKKAVGSVQEKKGEEKTYKGEQKSSRELLFQRIIKKGGDLSKDQVDSWKNLFEEEAKIKKNESDEDTMIRGAAELVLKNWAVVFDDFWAYKTLSDLGQQFKASLEKYGGVDAGNVVESDRAVKISKVIQKYYSRKYTALSTETRRHFDNIMTAQGTIDPSLFMCLFSPVDTTISGMPQTEYDKLMREKNEEIAKKLTDGIIKYKELKDAGKKVEEIADDDGAYSYLYTVADTVIKAAGYPIQEGMLEEGYIAAHFDTLYEESRKFALAKELYEEHKELLLSDHASKLFISKDEKIRIKSAFDLEYNSIYVHFYEMINEYARMHMVNSVDGTFDIGLDKAEKEESDRLNEKLKKTEQQRKELENTTSFFRNRNEKNELKKKEKELEQATGAMQTDGLEKIIKSHEKHQIAFEAEKNVILAEIVQDAISRNVIAFNKVSEVFNDSLNINGTNMDSPTYKLVKTSEDENFKGEIEDFNLLMLDGSTYQRFSIYAKKRTDRESSKSRLEETRERIKALEESISNKKSAIFGAVDEADLEEIRKAKDNLAKKKAEIADQKEIKDLEADLEKMVKESQKYEKFNEDYNIVIKGIQQKITERKETNEREKKKLEDDLYSLIKKARKEEVKKAESEVNALTKEIEEIERRIKEYDSPEEKSETNDQASNRIALQIKFTEEALINAKKNYESWKKKNDNSPETVKKGQELEGLVKSFERMLVEYGKQKTELEKAVIEYQKRISEAPAKKEALSKEKESKCIDKQKKEKRLEVLKEQIRSISDIDALEKQLDNFKGSEKADNEAIDADVEDLKSMKLEVKEYKNKINEIYKMYSNCHDINGKLIMVRQEKVLKTGIFSSKAKETTEAVPTVEDFKKFHTSLAPRMFKFYNMFQEKYMKMVDQVNLEKTLRKKLCDEGFFKTYAALRALSVYLNLLVFDTCATPLLYSVDGEQRWKSGDMKDSFKKMLVQQMDDTEREHNSAIVKKKHGRKPTKEEEEAFKRYETACQTNEFFDTIGRKEKNREKISLLIVNDKLNKFLDSVHNTMLMVGVNKKGELQKEASRKEVERGIKDFYQSKIRKLQKDLKVEENCLEEMKRKQADDLKREEAFKAQDKVVESLRTEIKEKQAKLEDEVKRLEEMKQKKASYPKREIDIKTKEEEVESLRKAIEAKQEENRNLMFELKTRQTVLGEFKKNNQLNPNMEEEVKSLRKDIEAKQKEHQTLKEKREVEMKALAELQRQKASGSDIGEKDIIAQEKLVESLRNEIGEEQKDPDLQAQPVAEEKQENQNLQVQPVAQQKQENQNLQVQPVAQQKQENQNLQVQPVAQQKQENQNLQAQPGAEVKQENQNLKARLDAEEKILLGMKWQKETNPYTEDETIKKQVEKIASVRNELKTMQEMMDTQLKEANKKEKNLDYAQDLQKKAVVMSVQNRNKKKGKK